MSKLDPPRKIFSAEPYRRSHTLLRVDFWSADRPVLGYAADPP
ncbi:hypothetical protein [Streptosporangium roseum]|nr:hypothetical protein [Streptosporangium roseum]